MGWRHWSERQRILSAVVLTALAGLCLRFNWNAGLPRGILGALLFVAATIAWANISTGKNRDEPTPVPPILASSLGDPNEAVQLLSGSGVVVAKELLESAGIPAFVKSSQSSTRYPNWTNPDGFGDLLMVPRSFLPQAREILNSKISDQELAAQAASEPPPED
jgi:hypothetical protein